MVVCFEQQDPVDPDQRAGNDEAQEGAAGECSLRFSFLQPEEEQDTQATEQAAGAGQEGGRNRVSATMADTISRRKMKTFAKAERAC